LGRWVRIVDYVDWNTMRGEKTTYVIDA